MQGLRFFLGLTLVVALATPVSQSTVVTASAASTSIGPDTRQLASRGTTVFTPTTEGSGAFDWPEFPLALYTIDASGGSTALQAPAPASMVNRSHSLAHGRAGRGQKIKGAKRPMSSPALVRSFDGLNFREQRLANNGNQFSVEPPDQALCVGNGFVLESVNDVLRVFDTAGNPLTAVIDLNTFYGYPARFNRATGEQGPSITDPVCYFDVPTQRWFHVALTLDVVPETGDLTGRNHLDLAVSQTADPTGAWTLYTLPVQNDGTEDTPDHDCARGPGSADATNPEACIGDFPHIGADQHGFYITTNEYDLFGPNFRSAQIYAISKQALAAGAPNLTVVQFDTIGLVDGTPGFTVWPATSPDDQYAGTQGGTEYFLSSMAAEEAGNTTGTDNRLAVWALTNTQSLEQGSLALSLRNTLIPVDPYSIPPKADQKPGDFPLGQCINDTTISTPFGPGCWQFFFLVEPAHDEVLSQLDSSDTRMLTTVYAHGKLWGALGTAVNVEGEEKAGIAWYIIQPEVTPAGITATLLRQDQLGVAKNNVIYPTIAVLEKGKGVMAFTLVGEDHYPSAAFAGIDARGGVSDIHIAAEGVGPHDGFTGYKAFVGDPPRTRWGDYGAATTDGKTIWLASEYIAQTCTLAQYLTDTSASPQFSCDRTRASLGNWATRITAVNP
jgi:hypothetical protein